MQSFMQSLFFLVLRGCALVLIFLMGSLALISPVGATSAMSHQASAKATKFVDNYVDRMQHGGYSTAEITDALIALRSTYINRQKSHLYSGSALSEIDAIIESLDTAIAGVSEGNCGTCDLYDPFNVYVPPRGNSVTTPTYPNSPYYLTNPSYPNYQYTPYTSQNTVTVTNTILSVDSSYSSQVRTDLSVTNAYRDYDMYTFSLQSNGYATNQPSSNRFITPNLVRQLSTQQ